jgi:hypothetical protein
VLDVIQGVRVGLPFPNSLRLMIQKKSNPAYNVLALSDKFLSISCMPVASVLNFGQLLSKSKLS